MMKSLIVDDEWWKSVTKVIHVEILEQWAELSEKVEVAETVLPEYLVTNVTVHQYIRYPNERANA